MATRKQIAANRKNARLSTGPVTPAGKSVASRNSIFHGAFAQDILLPGEDAGACRLLRQSFHDRYLPANETEAFLVDRMILAAWRLQRFAALEPRLILAHCEQAMVEREDPVAASYLRDAAGPDTINKLFRHQAALERSFYRALREFGKCRAAANSAPPESAEIPVNPAGPEPEKNPQPEQ